jgi:uncharacterized protein YbjT (DUF2867 family)
MKPVLALSGASGFMGRQLAAALQPRFFVRGLGRNPSPPGAIKIDEWLQTDLYNLKQAETALRGATVAVYLVHSMMPSARLTQAKFEDLDLLCADNFGRAAAKAGVKQIVYLGGLIPQAETLSPHLQSRQEVEQALSQYGTPVTSLRAGLILGGGGSSFEMLIRLVERLPVMICPAWTNTKTQPIAASDVVSLLSFAAGNPSCAGDVFDIASPDVITYRQLMAMVAEQLGVRRKMLSVKYFSPGLSRLWVTLVTGASRELVGPLVQSLKHEMTARDNRLATMAGLEMKSVAQALQIALAQRDEKTPERRLSRSNTLPPIKTAETPKSLEVAKTQKPSPSLVRSVQRMQLPAHANAAWAATEYTRWLPNAFWRLLRVDVDEFKRCKFCIIGMKRPLLELTYAADRSTDDRQLFYVTGGMLSRSEQRGRFELREIKGTNTLITAIHDFGPRLPWFIYINTQARFHSWVMSAFRRHIAKQKPLATHALKSKA